MQYIFFSSLTGDGGYCIVITKGDGQKKPSPVRGTICGPFASKAIDKWPKKE